MSGSVLGHEIGQHSADGDEPMVKRPIDLGRYVLRAESSAETLIGLFGRCPCETEELVAVRPSVSTKTFLDICGYGFGSVAKL